MQCKYHQTTHGAVTCSHCGDWICDDCTVSTQGRVFCRPCLASLAGGKPDTSPTSAYKKISFLGLLFFSFFPSGANYMYMGLMKRGLATMSGFFLLIFLFANSSMPLTLILVFSFVVLIIASFMDGFNVRRRLNAGEHVRDDIGEVLGAIMANKLLRTIILVVVAIVLITQILSFAANVIGAVLPWLVVGFIVIMVLKKRKPPVE